jgi:2-methylcitrate dehydratase PrpD
MGATEILASYATNLKYEDLPKEVVEQAKRIAMDLIGCIVSGIPLPLGNSIIEQAKEIGGGLTESRILGTDSKVSCVAAAYANGALSDVLDWNDMLFVGHPATAAVSASFSIGERQKASGKQIIEAIVAAYEVFGRIGISVQPTEERQKALWGMLTWIPFNAAVAAGKILGLNEAQMATAIGAAAAYAPLGACHKYVETRSDVYHYDHGMTSMAGVLAALNADKGLIGMNTILEGSTGFWVLAGSDQCDFDKLDALISTLGKDYWILKTLFKRWPANLWVQSYLDLLDDLVKNNKITAEDVAEINYAPSLGMLSTYRERGAMDAAFSLLYMLAIYILEPEPSTSWYSDENLHSPKVLELVKRVKKREGALDAELIHEFRNYWEGSWMPNQVEVVTKTGERFMGFTTFPKGHPSNPLSYEEMKQKFRYAASKVLGSSRVEEIISMIEKLEDIPDISELTDLLQ